MWVAHYTVSSTFAREYAAEVAALASLGFITTKMTGDIFGRIWRLTPKGLHHLHATER